MTSEASENPIVLTKKRAEKLEEIRKLFMWPMFLWFAIVLADFIFYVVEIDAFLEVRQWIGQIAFYSFPLVLIYLVFATFYSSYRILESRGYKNIATFFFFQMIAYFIIDVLQVEIPKYDKTTSVILTIVMCLAIFVIISLVQLRIKIPEGIINKRASEYPNESIGMVISAIFSIVIASMIYFRVKGGVSFVTWGTFFGIMLSSMVHKADKTILGTLYFLDPRGAINFFKIIQLKSEVEDERDLAEVEMELGSLTKAQMQRKALRLANELNQELHRVQFQDGERKIRALIDKLRDSDRLPPGQQQSILEEVTGVITRLRTEQRIPQALPEPDYSSLSIGEKISLQIGLSETEIQQALKEGLIDPQQNHLWTTVNQIKIRVALKEFEQEKYKGIDPVFVAYSWVPFFDANRHLLERVVTTLTSGDEFNLREIKGAERHELSELVFATPAREYSAVLRLGKNDSYLLVGVFDHPNQSNRK